MPVGEVPSVAPCCRQQATVKLRTVLCVIEQRHLTGGVHRLSHVLVHEGRYESRKLQLHLRAIFHEVLVRVALQPLDGLIGTTQLHTQQLAATKQVVVLIGYRRSSTQVARRVRTFRLETDGRGFVRLQLYAAVQRVGARHLTEVDVRIFHRLQSSKVVVRVLQSSSRIRAACRQVRTLL